MKLSTTFLKYGKVNNKPEENKLNMIFKSIKPNKDLM